MHSARSTGGLNGFGLGGLTIDDGLLSRFLDAPSRRSIDMAADPRRSTVARELRISTLERDPRETVVPREDRSAP